MDDTMARLATWLPHQRWFTTTGSAPQLRLLANVELPSPDPNARVRVLIVADDAPARPVVYQVPVVERTGPVASETEGWIDGSRGAALIEGPYDVAFTGALLELLAPRPAAAPGTAVARGEVLQGEQSNTSIIYRPGTGRPVICKLFRQLSAGTNPDIELQSALAGIGSPHVPAVVGVFDGRWADPVDATREAAGTLAFAQEFFPDVEDAWRVALRAAEAGEDFTTPAEELGRATAAVHRDLARLFPTPTADDAKRAALIETWRRRLEIAATEVPQLRPQLDAIRDRYAVAASTEWPALQRIHGDYHLGQVLQVPRRGWVLLDFEGEPMRPMEERRKPDLALRDIAGMLRSFDYVAGSLALTRATATAMATVWSAAARAAFLAGYRDVAGIDPAGPLLDALELEKAVYEAIYEARHRPGWLSIPLAAVDRLITLG